MARVNIPSKPDLDLRGKKLLDVANGGPDDAVNKAYVDNLMASGGLPEYSSSVEYSLGDIVFSVASGEIAFYEYNSPVASTGTALTDSRWTELLDSSDVPDNVVITNPTDEDSQEIVSKELEITQKQFENTSGNSGPELVLNREKQDGSGNLLAASVNDEIGHVEFKGNTSGVSPSNVRYGVIGNKIESPVAGDLESTMYFKVPTTNGSSPGLSQANSQLILGQDTATFNSNIVMPNNGTVDGVDVSALAENSATLEQLSGSNIWQESLRQQYLAGQQVSDFKIQTQGNVTTGLITHIDSANDYQLPGGATAVARASDETEDEYNARFTINSEGGVDTLTVTNVVINSGTGVTTISLSGTGATVDFTVTYPPANFGSNIGASTREYIRRATPAPTGTPTDAQELELRPITADFSFSAALGVSVSDYWIRVLINGSAWRLHQDYIEGDEVEYVDSQGIPRHVFCKVPHTSSERTNPDLSSAVSHTGLSADFDMETPWEPVGGSIDLSTGTSATQIQLMQDKATEGTFLPAVIFGLSESSDPNQPQTWSVIVGDGVGGTAQLEEGNLPIANDLISFGTGNTGTTEEYRVISVSGGAVTTLVFSGRRPLDVRALFDSGVLVNIFDSGMRDDLGQIDRLVFDPADFIVNTEAQNIGHGHVSLHPDEIVSREVLRNSDAQTVDQWIDETRNADGTEGANTALNFVFDAAFTQNYVTLAKNEAILTTPFNEVEFATEQNGNYHTDLLYFSTQAGRMILNTDHLQTALDNAGGGGVDVEETFPLTAALGHQILLDPAGNNVTVVDSNGHRRPRGFYSYIQPLSDPASRYWEQITIPEIPELYNNAREDDLIYLTDAEEDFNTNGNNFNTGFYRAGPTSANAQTWIATEGNISGDLEGLTDVVIDTNPQNGDILQRYQTGATTHEWRSTHALNVLRDDVNGILRSGGQGTTITLAVEAYPGLDIIKNDALFSDEDGNKSTALGDGEAPVFRDNIGQMSLAYTNLNAAQITLLENLVDADLVFRHPDDGAPLNDNLEDDDSFHFRLVDWHYQNANTRLLDFQLRDVSKQDAFIAKFGWTNHVGGAGATNRWYIPTNTGNTLITALVSQAAVADHIYIAGGSSVVGSGSSSDGATELRSINIGGTEWNVSGRTEAQVNAQIAENAIQASDFTISGAGNAITNFAVNTSTNAITVTRGTISGSGGSASTFNEATSITLDAPDSGGSASENTWYWRTANPGGNPNNQPYAVSAWSDLIEGGTNPQNWRQAFFRKSSDSATITMLQDFTGDGTANKTSTAITTVPTNPDLFGLRTFTTSTGSATFRVLTSGGPSDDVRFWLYELIEFTGTPSSTGALSVSNSNYVISTNGEVDVDLRFTGTTTFTDATVVGLGSEDVSDFNEAVTNEVTGTADGQLGIAAGANLLTLAEGGGVVITYDGTQATLSSSTVVSQGQISIPDVGGIVTATGQETNFDTFLTEASETFFDDGTSVRVEGSIATGSASGTGEIALWESTTPNSNTLVWADVNNMVSTAGSTTPIRSLLGNVAEDDYIFISVTPAGNDPTSNWALFQVGPNPVSSGITVSIVDSNGQAALGAMNIVGSLRSGDGSAAIFDFNPLEALRYEDAGGSLTVSAIFDLVNSGLSFQDRVGEGNLVTASNDLAILNDSNIGNNLTVGNDLTVTNDLTVSNDLTVTVDATITNDLNVMNNLDVDGDANVDGSLTVDVDTTISQDLTVTRSVNNSSSNAMAYWAMQLGSSIPTELVYTETSEGSGVYSFTANTDAVNDSTTTTVNTVIAGTTPVNGTTYLAYTAPWRGINNYVLVDAISSTGETVTRELTLTGTIVNQNY